MFAIRLKLMLKRKLEPNSMFLNLSHLNLRLVLGIDFTEYN